MTTWQFPRAYSSPMLQNSKVSRRAFAQILGAGAAVAALPFPLPAAPRSTGGVRLSANENPYGPSPAAMNAIRESLADVWRYPDEAADALADSIARLHGVSTDQVILGDGSSEILKLTAETFLDRNRQLIVADPTFEAIAAHAATMGAVVTKVPLDAGYAHDVPRMTKDAGVIYVCNPNNPTATITPKLALRTLISSVPATTTLLVDEAYHHYATGSEYESVIPLVSSYPNLIVSRTFSKIYGMAGLRCGYGVGQKATIERMRRQQAWDSMNTVAIAAARASLADKDHVTRGRQRNSDTRAWVFQQLDRLGYAHLPSETNFMMIDLRTDVVPVIRAMRERNVHVGRLFPALPHHLRVTVGTPEQMQRFVDAFRETMRG
jgi:histidinol-phosphate aminotransferase